MLLFFSSITSCSFKSVKPSIQQENLPIECDGLITIVEKNWKQHKKLKYYLYNEEFLTILQKDYKDCLMKLKKKDVISLLGQPTENLEEDYIYYSLNEGCMSVSPQSCKILVFHFREQSGQMFAIEVQSHDAILHNKLN